jgi:hypothetical protein
LAKIIFNPPPGWVVPEDGWMPSVSWQPPAEWPPIPTGWPLFLVHRTWVQTITYWVILVGSCAGWAVLMARLGEPLPVSAFMLVLLTLWAGCASSVVKVLKPAPLTKWPWLPNRVPETPSAV